MSTEKLDWGQISAFSEPKFSPGFTLWHEVTQHASVDFLGMDRMHISQIASRLEQSGLIERKMATTDIRAKHVRLTEKGRKLMAQAMPVVEEFDRAFFS